MGIRALGSRPALSGAVSTVWPMRGRSRERRFDDYFAVQGNRQQLRDGARRLSFGRTGPLHVPGQTQEQTLEDLIKLPFVQKVYLRPNWREVQKQPGRLDFAEWWKIAFELARRYDKAIGFRVHAGESRRAGARDAGFSA